MFWLVVTSALVLLASASCVQLARVPAGHRLTATLVTGLSFVVLSSEGLGSFGLYRQFPLTVASAAFAVVAGAARALVRVPVAPPRPAAPTIRRSLAVVCNLGFGLLLLVVVGQYAWRAVVAVRLPPLGYDSIYYHLVNVQQWLTSGSLSRPFSGLAPGASDPGALTQADSFPKNAELIGGWISVLTGSLSAVGTTQLVFVLLLCSSVTGVCRGVGIPAPIARLVGPLPGLCPVVLAQSSELYVDIARAACVTAALQLLLAALADRKEPVATRPLLVLSGLAAGLAVGVKSNNIVFVPVLLVVAVSLVGANMRAGVAAGEQPTMPAARRMRRTVIYLAAPMALTGAYWYLRTWVNWGSPVWPYAAGPFSGRSGTVTSSALLQQYYHANSSFSALYLGWWRAVSEFDAPVRGDQRIGGLGLAWLIALPLVLLVLVRFRWNPRGALAVVLPVLIGTLCGPASFNTRYSIPLVVAGAVAFAIVLDRLARHQRPVSSHARPRRRRSALILVPLFVIGLLAAGSADAWSATRMANWYLKPSAGAQPSTLAEEVDAVRSPAAVRQTYGYGPLYAPTLDKVPAGTPIAFWADQTPQFTYTFPAIGDHRLHVLATTTDQSLAGLERSATGYRYVFLPAKSPAIAVLTTDPAVTNLGPVADGVVLELPPR